MTTIKVSVPVSPETIEREITLPAYRKSKDGEKFVKVISADEGITVYYHPQNGSVNIQVWNFCGSGELDLKNRDLMDSTKEEFEGAFERALDRLSNLQIQHA